MSENQVGKAKKNVKRIIVDAIIFSLFIVVCISGYLTYDFFHKEHKVVKEINEVHEIVQNSLKEEQKEQKTEDQPLPRFTSQTFQDLKAVNSDIVGYIDFESNMISLPIVQAKDNDFYLRRNFNKQYSVLGVPFMDYRSRLDKQNIVVYGHNSSYDENVMFSPLRKLVADEEFFRQNEKFTIYYENEVREYQIVAMYWFNTLTETNSYHDFTVSSWNNKAFNHYWSWVEQRNLIKANTGYSIDDYFITLQTCRSFKTDERLITVAKEISARVY